MNGIAGVLMTAETHRNPIINTLNLTKALAKSLFNQKKTFLKGL